MRWWPCWRSSESGKKRRIVTWRPSCCLRASVCTGTDSNMHESHRLKGYSVPVCATKICSCSVFIGPNRPVHLHSGPNVQLHGCLNNEYPQDIGP